MKLSTFLKRVLMLDAASCLAMGALLTIGADGLAALFGLDEAIVRGAGIALLPIAAFIAWLGTRAVAAAGLVYILIFGNLLWVAESLAVVSTASGITVIGIAFVGAQAAAVAGLTWLEWIGVRRSGTAAA